MSTSSIATLNIESNFRDVRDLISVATGVESVADIILEFSGHALMWRRVFTRDVLPCVDHDIKLVQRVCDFHGGSPCGCQDSFFSLCMDCYVFGFDSCPTCADGGTHLGGPRWYAVSYYEFLDVQMITASMFGYPYIPTWAERVAMHDDVEPPIPTSSGVFHPGMPIGVFRYLQSTGQIVAFGEFRASLLDEIWGAISARQAVVRKP
jgi:hypothetical protein